MAPVHGTPRQVRNLIGGYRGIRIVPYLTQYLGYATYHFPQLHHDDLRVLMVGWELEQLPRRMTEELAGADIIVAMSDFNARVFSEAFPRTPVVLAPLLPPTVHDVVADRRRFGLPEDHTIVLSTFDPISGFDRKNPTAVLDAFTRAFARRDEATLVFKTQGLDRVLSRAADDPEARRAKSFLDRCEQDPRVMLLDQTLPYADVQALTASSDIYISLSRAEGFGLPVLEAMSLGIPTVCTEYSGHRDFAHADSVAFVHTAEVPVTDDPSQHYRAELFDRTPHWGEADVDHAAHHLRQLADSPALRAHLGASGQRQAARYGASARSAPWVRDLLTHAASTHVTDQHAERHRAFENFTRLDERDWRNQGEALRRARRSLRLRTALGRLKSAAVRHR